MIPVNVKTKIQSGSHMAHSIIMQESKQNAQNSNNVVRHSSARMVDEPTPAQARAIDKVLRRVSQP